MAKIKLFVLGTFTLMVDGQFQDEFRSARVRALLAYLALESRRPILRTQLTEVIWGGYQHGSALASLRVGLANLRQALDPLQMIVTTRQSVKLNIHHPDFWCDALALDALAKGERDAASLTRLNELSDASHLELLPGFEYIDSPGFQAWLQERRAYYQPLLAGLKRPTAQRLLAGDLVGNLVAAQGKPPAPVADPVELAEGVNSAFPIPALAGDGLDTVPDMAAFYGRQAELEQLTTWVVDQPGAARARLVAILGMGGQGKSALAAHWIRSFLPPPQPGERAGERAFAHTLWSSLLNAPPLHEILQHWIQVLSHQQVSQLPPSLDQQLDLLLGYLRHQRCLLVLDNVESILATGERAGQYRPGYEGYGQLLQRVGEFDHQSCLLLTSREEPYGWTRLALGATAIRSLRLGGLVVAAGQTMLHELGLSGDGTASAEVVRRYSGNPLALKLVAAVIQELFAGHVRTFLADETLVFDDIRDVLDQHFARLSPLEREVINWLAIEREPVGLSTLFDDLVHSPSRRVVLETLRSLHRRSLLERDGERLSLQNVVLEYTTDRLVEDFGFWMDRGATENPKSAIINRFALVKAQAKEYVRASQRRMLLQPAADQLAARLGVPGAVQQLQRLLAHLRQAAPRAPGYAGANLLHLLLQLGVDLRGYDFSHLSLRQADLSGVRLPQVNLVGADLTGARFTETLGLVRGLAFSPNGKFLVVGTRGGEITTWRLADHQLCQVIQAHTQTVNHLAFCPKPADTSFTGASEGELLASVADDQTAALWAFEPGEGGIRLLRRLRGHTGPVSGAAFHPDGKLLASAGDDGAIRLWSVAAAGHGQPEQAVLHSERLWKIAFSPRPEGPRQALASASQQTVRLWDTAAWTDLGVLAGHSDVVTAFAFSPRPEGPRQLLASASLDGTVCLWDWAQRKLLYRLEHPGAKVYAVAFRPDGKLLASASDEPLVRLWDARTGELRQSLPGHTHIIWQLAFHPDGKLLASAGSDQTVHLWAVENQAGTEVHLQAVLRGHRQVLSALALSADGKLLAAVGWDPVIHLWRLHNGEPVATEEMLHGHHGQLHALAFTPDGRTLATAGRDQAIHVWALDDGRLRYTLRGHRAPVNALAVHPNGQLLASAGSDSSVCLWDLATGQLRQQIHGHTGGVNSIAFHPSGRWLASGGDDQTIRLWALEGGEAQEVVAARKSVQDLGEHEVLAVAFSPDGSRLASSGTRRVCLWDFQSGERLHVSQPILWTPSLAFSPDGKTLASGSHDFTIRLWDTQKGQLICTLHGHTGGINSLVFVADGVHLWSTSDDGTLKLWDTQRGECIYTLRPDGPYAGMNITGVTGISEAQKAALIALGAVENENCFKPVLVVKG